ncbi:MAG: creatininase family protein, partial [Candidatus Zixiibacteriota bacterium]
NNNALKAVAYEFHHEKKANIAVIHWWELCAEMTHEFFGHYGGHAGTDETAMVQAKDTRLVDKEMYDPDLAYYFRSGADVYPVPGSILLYKEGEGYPNFDLEQAKKYREKVVGLVGDFAEMVLDRWRKFNL